ncbi:DUF58 domain-containing protein [uncultured Actinomyces sp.]|uniref:DUF58 domain-containing protein n=1 Tax=uncultured Actinomyces sp. TaxID=249061 RepID=UPI001CAE76B7|nr:DUF58 domain-containing protein [uncultured Actinomyces sp.]MBF0959482.1 DUF58 domain-containing protein [Actinomyces sp.]
MAPRSVADKRHLRERLDAVTRARVGLARASAAVASSWRHVIDALRRVRGVGALMRLGSSVTPLGWGTTLVGAGAALAGSLASWVEAAVLGFTCLSLVALSLLWSLGRAGHTVALRLANTRVTVGEKALGALTVTNPTSRRLRATKVELCVGAGANSFLCPPLGRGESHEEVFAIATTRRGIVAVGPASTIRGDSLGLVRRVQTWSDATELYIHPRTVAMNASTVGFIRDIEGATTQDLSSADVSFHALREYVPGDDRRAIHWRSTARIGKLMVRQFEETRRSHLLIVLDLDTDAWASDDEFEIGVSAAASMARAALVDAKEVSVHTQAGHLKTPTPMHAMDSLSGVERVLGAERISALTQRAGTEASQASTAVVISGSRTHLADLHAALTRLPLDMVITGVRIDTDSDFELRTLGNTPVVVAPTLDDFAIGMWKALG